MKLSIVENAIAASSACLVFLACAGSDMVKEPESRDTVRQPVAVTEPMVTGYAHSMSVSRFNPGSKIAEKNEFGMHKIIGDQGVFATRSSGLATALPNADSAAQRGAPLDGTESHNAAVRDYFVSAGLPEDQVGSIQDFETVSAPITVGQTFSGKGTVKSRYSMLKRQIEGVPVPNSFAWARMNADGIVAEEQIYWPPIPRAVVDRAVALAKQVATDSGKAKFEAMLPKHGDVKGVIIHHSPGEWDKSFESAAVYEVGSDSADFPAMRHFDPAGSMLELAFEKAGAWGTGPSIKR